MVKQEKLFIPESPARPTKS